MFKFILNGQEKSVDENKKLLKYLRDDCNITSVKNGCSEGACGTCMVIVDGKAIKACVLTTEKVNGKTITTIEGFTDREREVFAYAFTEAGAVQCGFCIPGMVISAKALFNRTLEPTMEDVKKALIGNICRCTGYVKIEKAIMMAAEIFRKNKEVPKVSCKGLIGEPMARVDARDKTLGLGEYTDDIRIEGMVYGAALRSKYPRALVKSMDITEAENLKGVIKIVTAEDIPGQRYLGHLKKDTPALIKVGEETRYLGDAVALVAAETEEIAKEALKYIKVDFEELKPLSSPIEALKDDAPKIHEGGNILVHEHLVRGNADEAIKKSKYVVTNKYSVPFTEHAFLEPEAAVAVPDGEDGLIVYTGTQSIYDDLREIGSLLNLGEDKLRIISEYVGGGFGGKEDMSCQHHTALLAYLIKKPVKMCLTRQESIMVDTKRHAMEMEFTTACDENGKLTAMKAEIIADTGAYASLGGPVLQRACTHAAGPYNYQNMVVDGIAVYTNNTPGGAFRGFGVTQSAFATECNLNQLAEMVGIDPFEIRMLNAIRPGEVLANGQIADEGTALVETLEAVKDSYYSNKYAGIACTFKNAGVGVGIPDTGRCKVKVIDGKVHIRTSAACIGQGVGTVVVQVVGEILGIPASQIVYETPDTRITPNSGTTTASRQTVFTGEATRIASLKLKEALKGKSLQELEGIEFLGEYIGITDKMGSPKENPVSHVAYGFATQVVIIDEKGKLVKVVAAHDVGKAINPKNVEGQIEGGVVMGLGYGLTEDYIIENSVPKVKFGTLGLLRATQVPEIVPIIIEKNTQELSFGAKGVGEITCIPTAPAVQGAYYKLDGIFRRELPLKNTFYKKIKK